MSIQGQCGYRWLAPYIRPPSDPMKGKGPSFREQVCAEPRGHEGPHRSWSNVTLLRHEPRTRTTEQ
jgi:hypothetical protein